MLLCVGGNNFTNNSEQNVYAIFFSRTQAKLIDGKKIAEDIQKELRMEIDEWVRLGHRKPCLVAVLVGKDQASKKYVQNKMIAAKNVGKKNIFFCFNKFRLNLYEPALTLNALKSICFSYLNSLLFNKYRLTSSHYISRTKF